MSGVDLIAIAVTVTLILSVLLYVLRIRVTITKDQSMDHKQHAEQNTPPFHQGQEHSGDDNIVHIHHHLHMADDGHAAADRLMHAVLGRLDHMSRQMAAMSLRIDDLANTGPVRSATENLRRSTDSLDAAVKANTPVQVTPAPATVTAAGVPLGDDRTESESLFPSGDFEPHN